MSLKGRGAGRFRCKRHTTTAKRTCDEKGFNTKEVKYILVLCRHTAVYAKKVTNGPEKRGEEGRARGIRLQVRTTADRYNSPIQNKIKLLKTSSGLGFGLRFSVMTAAWTWVQHQKSYRYMHSSAGLQKHAVCSKQDNTLRQIETPTSRNLCFRLRHMSRPSLGYAWAHKIHIVLRVALLEYSNIPYIPCISTIFQGR